MRTQPLTLGLALALSLGLGLGMQAARADEGPGSKLETRFKSADKDADGTLDKAEAAAMRHVERHFEALDTDKDGTVSLEELRAGMRTRGMHGREKAQAQFKSADKDGDGTLDKGEAAAMPGVAKRFEQIDADKDGTVSLEELHAFAKGHMHGM